MKTRLTLGYSTCPNDTHIFYAIAAQKIPLADYSFDITLEDVETLNLWAEQKRLDITKLSFANLGYMLEDYALLKTGAALGRGCGPLIVARPGFRLDRLSRAGIAVPGMRTTACMLLGLFLNHPPDATPLRFDHIMPAVAAGNFEAGVIIHEGRFTYQNYGLICIADLGQWWENETGSPIPLGGIAVRRDLCAKHAGAIEDMIRASVRFARAFPEQTWAYIQTHAQELSPEVIRDHIRLYVNDFTENLGSEGISAVRTLFSRARAAGLLPQTDRSDLQHQGFIYK